MRFKDKKKHHIEDSVSLRLVSSTMSIVGVLAAGAEADTPLWLMCSAVPGIIVGSWLSYRRRYANNFVVKIWISVGILVVAAAFFKELLIRLNLSVADARIPLTNMLIALQALHCFDLPRRRDLSLSAVVGLTLLSSAATLSHDTVFGIYLFIFCAFGMLMLRFDCASRSTTRASRRSGELIQVAAPYRNAESRLLPAFGAILLFAAGSLVSFAVMPRVDISLLRRVRVSGNFDLSFLNDPTMNSILRSVSADGSIKASPNAYYGFAETLDTNYRGKLSDEIVLRVSSPIGTYWRGMAYDAFDGAVWTMTHPKPCASRVCRDGVLIDLRPVPGLDLRSQDFDLASTEQKRELTQVFYVEASGSNLVVCAPIPRQIYFPSPSLQLDRYGALRSPVGVEREMVYTVVSHMPYRNATTLSAMRIDPEEQVIVHDRMGNYLQVPKNLQPGVRALTDRVAGEGNWYQQARRICLHLQSGYKYDLNVEPAGKDSVSEFLLRRRTGYCEQFATSFCVMCRLKGIPARLVTGYMPGSYNALTGMWDVKLSDAHSWGEVYIPHVGWVAFDPTPEAVSGAFEGIEQRSTWSFLADQLQQGLIIVAQSPVAQGLTESCRFGLRMCARLAEPLGGSWVVAVLTASVIAIAIGFKDKLKSGALFRRLHDAANKTGSMAFVDAATSASMRQVLQELTVLEVSREPSDTLDDVLTKTRQSLEKQCNSQAPAAATTIGEAEAELRARFLKDLEGFFDEYAVRRYGGKPGEASLKELSLSLSRMIGILSKVE